jgi:uncharacterized membrane protein YsdA (DUF1294 family)
MALSLNTNFFIALGFFGTINLIAFLIMLWDKNRSKNRNNRRISEGLLFFMATCFGSVGVYAGMFAFRHKTQKWYFLVGIPLLIIQNIALMVLTFLSISGIIR